MTTPEEDIVFINEADAEPDSGEVWRILIVDDDSDVHAATLMAMEGTPLVGRKLTFIHAYSAEEARTVLAREANIAVILLDVVMESDDAGLQLVGYIRDHLAMHDVRIILRTGQPGSAPEMDVIRNYDINDYKTKSEFTRTKLCTVLTTAIRSYEQLCHASLERQRLEAEQINGEMRFRFMATTANEAMVVTNEQHQIEFWNAGAENLFGLTQEKAIGKTLAFTIPEIYRDSRKRSFAKMVSASDQASELQLIISPLPENKRQIPVEVLISSWDTGNGMHYSSIFRDISERCRYEEELIAARDAATASTRAKADFLANISHEIRTPMHGILGMTDLVLTTDLTTEQREYIKLAHSSAEGLLALINDILDFSKIEAGKLTLDRSAFNLRHNLQEIIKPQLLRAQQRGIELTLAIAPELPQTLIGDPLRVRQLILNLVSIALKFTETGCIAIRIEMLASEANRVLVQCSVRDTGVGVPADKLGSIFDAFTQADTSISREYGGTGLGLSICSQLVHLMRGKIWVESTPGKGSNFVFSIWLDRPEQENTLPTHCAVANPVPEDAKAPFKALKILLAEDNPVNQKFALTVLGKAGHHMRLAENGRQAVDLTANETFDVILMDVQMPVMDGFEATREIRKAGTTTPIIALSAQTVDGFRSLCLEAGMNDYISKPIRADALLRTLAALSNNAPHPHTVQASPITETSQVLDLAEALLTVGGDQNLLVGLTQLVLKQLDEDIPLLWALSRANDSAQLKDIAHRLKGSLASMAATPALDACKKLEALAKTGNTGEFTAAMEKLDKEISRLRPALYRIVGQ